MELTPWQHMFHLNNFNSLMAVLAGINMSAIYRLKFTREQIPDQTKRVRATSDYPLHEK